MLGLRGLVVKTHGNSEAVEICNAIEQCILFKKKNINGQFIESMGLGRKEEPKEAPVPGFWFCTECGKPQPAPKPAAGEWTCECGAVNKGKFCTECGKPRQ